MCAIMPRSLAAHAGLRVGDTILSVNGRVGETDERILALLVSERRIELVIETFTKDLSYLVAVGLLAPDDEATTLVLGEPTVPSGVAADEVVPTVAFHPDGADSADEVYLGDLPDGWGGCETEGERAARLGRQGAAATAHAALGGSAAQGQPSSLEQPGAAPEAAAAAAAAAAGRRRRRAVGL